MHRIAATPGGWDSQAEGVIILEQTPAPIVFLTAADTEIQTLARAVTLLPDGFPELRVANLLHLQQQLTIDTYAEAVLEAARVIVLRLLGGRSYWAYGLEVVREVVQRTGAALLVLPGDDRPDPELLSHSTLPLTVVNQLWRYLNEAGVENLKNALLFTADVGLGTDYRPLPPTPVPAVGRYQPAQEMPASQPLARVGILFYRAHYLAGNTAPIDALYGALVAHNLAPVALFVSSLREPDVQTEVLKQFQAAAREVSVVLNTTSFAIAQLDPFSQEGAVLPDLWQQLNVPVLQVILSSGTVDAWESNLQGLSPRDMAMNVVLPEVDGRIITRAISFKVLQTRNAALETDVVTYEPVADRVGFVADLAANWCRLQKTPIGDRKIALILANYPTRDGRLANGVGLDTPASCVKILQALQAAGYTLDRLPQDSDQLIRWLTSGVTNDPESRELRPVHQVLPLADYQQYFQTLPAAVQQGIGDRWGGVDQLPQADLAIPGIQLGNIFVGIQPARGYDKDPALNYHAPDLEPTHEYLAFYHWLRTRFATQAIVHVGKHGNLEWLPGKSIALSTTCYPEVAFAALPHLYPFIVNDPGEGAQAKRRAQAVILDHLTPPLTRAELYGGLHQLENLVDEYYEAQSLDPSRLELIRSRILQLVETENLQQDLRYRLPEAPAFPALLTFLDSYLCELKEAQIRDGLHIFGECPAGRQLRDLVIAIARHPAAGRVGLTRAIAQTWDLEFDPLTSDPAQPVKSPRLPGCFTVREGIAAIEAQAASLIETLPVAPIAPTDSLLDRELAWIQTRLMPALHQTEQEILNLLRGLNGEYIPAGASGAPTRGRSEVLPTGRNFYSVDIRAIPTETAWDVGRRAAEALVERYTQEHGEYPRSLGLSIWGTSTMRTGGDDLAEALALLGVRPVWEGAARRVIDFEILPLTVLGRPRVDVTLRISGFFRDAFANLIHLFDQAVTAVAALNEPPEQNPLAAQVQQETQQWQTLGLTPEQAIERASFRIFGSKPGAYGAGLQGLIEAQNWQDDSDLARAYINWSSYAYRGQGQGRSAAEAFSRRLQGMQVVLHNQDNREHDLLDSDDYYQFQGGLTAAVRATQGKNPTVYFGDHSLPENPKVRRLQEEIARVYRSRVVNPKWIAGALRHGYKGAFEMAATIDYLFAYDATANCVEDFMYQGVAEAYLLDDQVQEFVRQKNPWALRDMAERLLEAHQRGLWQQVQGATLEQLRALVNEAEGEIESR